MPDLLGGLPTAVSDLLGGLSTAVSELLVPARRLGCIMMLGWAPTDLSSADFLGLAFADFERVTAMLLLRVFSPSIATK